MRSRQKSYNRLSPTRSPGSKKARRFPSSEPAGECWEVRLVEACSTEETEEVEEKVAVGSAVNSAVGLMA